MDVQTFGLTVAVSILISALIMLAAAIPFIAVYFIKKKRYEATEYYAQTGLPFSECMHNKGAFGEYKIGECLEKIEGCKKLMFNLYIPTESDKTTELDVLMIHESGIYLFESKNYSGWIFGSEDKKEWVQSFKAGRRSTKKEYFFNPIMQNHMHMKWLQNFIKDNSLSFYSYIVFGNGCELKNVTTTTGNHAVVCLCQLYKSVCSNAKFYGNRLTQEQIEDIYEKLLPYTKADRSEKEKHIKDIKEKYYFSAEDIENYNNREEKCPFCGKKLVIRTVAKGSRSGKHFITCSGYPKCRYTQNIVETDDGNAMH